VVASSQHRLSLLLGLIAPLASCGGSTARAISSVDASSPPSLDAHFSADVSSAADGSPDVSTPADAVSPPGIDAASDAPRNASCTPTSSETGTAVSTDYGRLDGTLVYVVDVGKDPQCNGDDSHVHLQIQVSGSIYDVAVDIGTAPNDEVGILQQTMALPGGAWQEGWHATAALSYTSLGLMSASFLTTSPDPLAAQVEGLLASTTQISIFCKGYKQGNGCHDVHYENGYDDGAIFLDPSSAMSPVLFFRFTDQSF
jgi:hypothetical protein